MAIRLGEFVGFRSPDNSIPIYAVHVDSGQVLYIAESSLRRNLHKFMYDKVDRYGGEWSWDPGITVGDLVISKSYAASFLTSLILVGIEYGD